MTTLTAANERNAKAWRARGAAGWIGLAAAPTFALMAWIAATDPSRIAICSSTSGMPPIGGMAWMYLLMSLFHVSPWLKLISDRQRRITHRTPQN
jgi:uncharacterized RDD family membrane protein YckC